MSDPELMGVRFSNLSKGALQAPLGAGKEIRTRIRLLWWMLSGALLAGYNAPCAQGQVSGTISSWQDAQGNWHSGQPPAAGYRPAPLTPAQIQQQQEAAKQRAVAAQLALQAYQDQERRIRENVQRSKDEAQQELNSKKQEALQAMKDDGTAGGFSPELKEDNDSGSPAQRPRTDFNPGLKDAVADTPNGGNVGAPTTTNDAKPTGDRTAFDKKGASRDLFVAAANGNTALGRASAILASDTYNRNDSLQLSLESAKADAAKKFDDPRAGYAGQIDTVVLTDDPGSPAEPVKVPVQVGADPHFKALVVERDALRIQVQEVRKQLDTVKADPSFAKDGALLTKADKLQAAVFSLKVMDDYDTKKMDRMVHLEKVDFGDDASTPISKPIEVPPPAH